LWNFYTGHFLVALLIRVFNFIAILSVKNHDEINLHQKEECGTPLERHRVCFRICLAILVVVPLLLYHIFFIDGLPWILSAACFVAAIILNAVEDRRTNHKHIEKCVLRKDSNSNVHVKESEPIDADDSDHNLDGFPITGGDTQSNLLVGEGQEGARMSRTSYAVVRDPKLRAEAITFHGNRCCVCGFSFDEVYGSELGGGYIEVHHLKRISEGERKTNARTDLAPLCSNCHAMADKMALNYPNPPTTISDLRQRLKISR